MTADAALSGPGRRPLAETARYTRRAAMASVSVALILTVAKSVAWLASDSVSLLSSLADSALDVAASLVTLVAVTYAAAPPDAEHRFGHGKAEGVAALFQAALVLVSATLVAREAVAHILDPRPVTEGGLALAVVALSLVLTGGLLWFQTLMLRKTASVAVRGDRAHYMSDFLINGAVAAGVIFGAFFGASRADAAIGFIVAVWLGFTALSIARGSWDLLLDREMADAVRDKITALALEDSRILSVHQLRTRANGAGIVIQFHADLAPDTSLAEAHAAIVAAEKRILRVFPAADVLIHPDPRGKAEPHGQELLARQRPPMRNGAA